jgi:nitrogenase subunit NifH
VIKVGTGDCIFDCQKLQFSIAKHIPKSVKVGEANLQSKCIVDYMPTNKAAIAYQELTKELINNG